MTPIFAAKLRLSLAEPRALAVIPRCCLPEPGPKSSLQADAKRKGRRPWTCFA